MKLLWYVPLCLIACIGSSLVAVWALSSVVGFSFNPSIVAVLSGTVCAAAIAHNLRSRGDKNRNAA